MNGTLGRTARLDAWRFLLLCVGVSIELARYCFANNALNGGLCFSSESTSCCSCGSIEKLIRFILYVCFFAKTLGLSCDIV